MKEGWKRQKRRKENWKGGEKGREREGRGDREEKRALPPASPGKCRRCPGGGRCARCLPVQGWLLTSRRDSRRGAAPAATAPDTRGRRSDRRCRTLDRVGASITVRGSIGAAGLNASSSGKDARAKRRGGGQGHGEAGQARRRARASEGRRAKRQARVRAKEGASKPARAQQRAVASPSAGCSQS